MPKVWVARHPVDEPEERQVRKLARSRHAPGDWIVRARMIVRSWAGLRTTTIAHELGGHPQTVRERLGRFNTAGIDGLGDRPGADRTPRLTELERRRIIVLARDATRQASSCRGRLPGPRARAGRPVEPGHADASGP